MTASAPVWSFGVLWLILSGVGMGAFPVNAGTGHAEPRVSPAFAPVVDVPSLPRVLLIGDSVSIGYTARVRFALKGKANVHRAPVNCGPTTKGVSEIDSWLGHEPWDVIHFNFGLHDLRYVEPGVLNVPAKRYEANLRRIVDRLKVTGAKLIWASTTPVPEKAKAGQFPRSPADLLVFNTIASRLMGEEGVVVNDLYATVLPCIAEWQPLGDVHFNSRGYDVLGAAVAASVAKQLPSETATARDR